MARDEEEASADALRERVLQQIGDLLDVTTQAERGASDVDFARASPMNRIHYVFDYNIFDAFVASADDAGSFTLFHGPTWSPYPERNAAIRSLRRQIAMLTCEYLLSGNLPGQQDATVFMTQWHINELHDQVSRHQVELAMGLADQKEHLERFLREADRLCDDDNAKDPVALERLLAGADRTLRGDTRALLEAGVGRDRVFHSIQARRIAELLADDKFAVPVHQLARLTSVIYDRIQPIGAKFYPTEKEQDELRKDVERWTSRLQNERARRANLHHRPIEEVRSEGALRSDARSIAYVLWATHNRLPKNERIAFVSADALVFDAYRRWFIEQDTGEPFLLRRAGQFSPILRLALESSRGADEFDADTLFTTAATSAEAALIPFNLARRLVVIDRRVPQTGEQGLDHWRPSNREHFALMLTVDRTLERTRAIISWFTERLPSNWFSERRKELEGLARDWRRAERMAIGTSLELVLQRLASVRKPLALVVARGRKAQDALTEYYRDLFDEITRNSIGLFFPLATAFVQDLPNRGILAQRGMSRAPIALRLSISGTTEAEHGMDIGGLIDRWIHGDAAAAKLLSIADNPKLTECHDVLFAIAATTAVRLGDWSDAARFADLALRTSYMRSGDPGDFVLEYEYLRALTCRFRMGDADPRRIRPRANIWRRDLDTCLKALSGCEQKHRAIGCDQGSSQVLRTLRAVSERAAARLFYSTWGAVIPDERLWELGIDPSDALQEQQKCVADLRQCLNMETQALERAGDDKARQEFFHRLERQYVANLGSSQIVGFLLELKGYAPEKLTDIETRDLLDRYARMTKQIDSWPLISKIDVRGYQALVHGTPQAIHVIRSYKRADLVPQLSIDGALFDAVVSHLGTEGI